MVLETRVYILLKEKKQLYIKHKCLENSMILNELMEQSEFDEKDFTPSYIDTNNENMQDFIKTFEDNLLSKKKKRKKGIENFLEGEDIIEDDKGGTLPIIDLEK